MPYVYIPNSLHVAQLQKRVEYGVFALIVQALDSAIQQINHYTVDKYLGN